jgi:hypothetical protein
MKKILDFSAIAIAILLVISILFPFIASSFYNHPSIMDDYFCGMLVQKSGVKGFMDYIINWGSSRYIGNLLHTCNPLVWDSFTAYYYTPILFMLILVASFYFLISRLTQKIFHTYQYLFASLCFLAILLAFLPTTAEFFYWFSSAVLYVPSTVFCFLFFAFFSSYTQNPRKVYLVLLLILAFLILGTSEIIIIFWLLVLFYMAIITFQQGNYKLSRNLIMLFCCASLFFVFITFVLGSHRRMGGTTSFTVENLITTTKITFQYLQQVFSWSKNVVLCCFTILYLPFAAQIARKIKLQHFNPFFATFYSIFIFFVLLFAFILFAKLVYQRVLSTIYVVFILLWFFNITLYVAYSLRKYAWLTNIKIPPRLAIIPLVIIATKVFSTNTKVGVAYRDLLSGAMTTTDKELKARYVSIKQQKARGLRTVRIKPLTNYLEVISFRTDFEEQDVHSNFFAQYWQVDSVKYENKK